ncbi:hypothetical protein GCM10010260_81460 [Streptomyces filipinensis]|uniref:Transposase for insertion sequence element IS21-like C-terminal domain-containing protein n=1 Tax=Streptomyces filipinensis TaxID=66887 RepID=A0A918IK45_9ACTN|nr:hypothetical protein [Streptomyces filipinensis]GGV28659.1 hypothetical protein GCM10010260_81460 [Streptomyces filipinensis]
MLKPLPTEPFKTARLFALRVERYSQVSVRTNHYSVAVRLIGRRVWVMLHASVLVVYDEGVEVAQHERLMTKAGPRLVLDHYLEVLVREPGALPGSTALNRTVSQGSSPRSTTPGGPLPARPTATGTAREH